VRASGALPPPHPSPHATARSRPRCGEPAVPLPHPRHPTPPLSTAYPHTRDSHALPAARCASCVRPSFVLPAVFGLCVAGMLAIAGLHKANDDIAAAPFAIFDESFSTESSFVWSDLGYSARTLLEHKLAVEGIERGVKAHVMDAEHDHHGGGAEAGAALERLPEADAHATSAGQARDTLQPHVLDQSEARDREIKSD
jgi:hypothetical protein